MDELPQKSAALRSPKSIGIVERTGTGIAVYRLLHTSGKRRCHALQRTQAPRYCCRVWYRRLDRSCQPQNPTQGRYSADEARPQSAQRTMHHGVLVEPVHSGGHVLAVWRLGRGHRQRDAAGADGRRDKTWRRLHRPGTGREFFQPTACRMGRALPVTCRPIRPGVGGTSACQPHQTTV